MLGRRGIVTVVIGHGKYFLLYSVFLQFLKLFSVSRSFTISVLSLSTCVNALNLLHIDFINLLNNRVPSLSYLLGVINVVLTSVRKRDNMVLIVLRTPSSR